jgi:hypothetical protein
LILNRKKKGKSKMEVKDIRIENGNVHGVISVNLPFMVIPKRRGSRMASFGGRASFRDESGKEYALAWDKTGGRHVYFDCNDDVCVFIEDGVVEEPVILTLRDFLEKDDSVKEAVQAFGENLMEREKKNMAKIKKQEEQQDIDTLTKEKSELADMLKELERIEADDVKNGD